MLKEPAPLDGLPPKCERPNKGTFPQGDSTKHGALGPIITSGVASLLIWGAKYAKYILPMLLLTFKSTKNRFICNADFGGA